MSQRTELSRRRSLGGIGASLMLSAAFVVAASEAAWAQSSAPVDTVKIVIGENNTGSGQLPITIALDEGFFKKAGLTDISGVMLSGGTPPVMAAFASGSVNILNLSVPELIEYTGSKVISGKAFGETIDQTYDIVATKDLTNIQDIKGKTIGILGPNSAEWIYFLGLMQHYGIPANSVTFISSGSPVNRLAELSTGAIQVTAATNNLRDQSMKVGNILLKSSDSPVQFPGNVLIANDDLLANHKPALKQFLAAMSAATAWMKANPAAAAADCAKLSGATVQACTNSIAFNFDRSISSPYTWSSNYAINAAGVKSALDVMATIQPNTKGLTVDDIADTSLAGTTP